MVDKYFNEELEEFQKIFPNIVIKTGSDDLKLKPKVRLHPILKLRNYIDKHHIKLIDFGEIEMKRDIFAFFFRAFANSIGRGN